MRLSDKGKDDRLSKKNDFGLFLTGSCCISIAHKSHFPSFYGALSFSLECKSVTERKFFRKKISLKQHES